VQGRVIFQRGTDQAANSARCRLGGGEKSRAMRAGTGALFPKQGKLGAGSAAVAPLKYGKIGDYFHVVLKYRNFLQ
jgi:hypothetical protein